MLLKDKVDMGYLINFSKYKKESEGARTFQVSVSRFWNSLSNGIKSSSSLEILKKSLYKYFLKSYKDVHHFT